VFALFFLDSSQLILKLHNLKLTTKSNNSSHFIN